jgi:tRNA nucleotidyltransferase (CCA-adding enzyme)
MEVYLVGGAVRDKYLGRPVTDRDWVVVGSTPEAMIAAGYVPVGKAFPVFLHPKTKEEYALARTEKKSGHGYQGFTFNASPQVTLGEDLARRDITINAMAEDESGKLVDPYRGLHDLEHKVLRHVSPAFVEDPVRLLRVARFAARFDAFSLHPDTKALLVDLVHSGEVQHLVADRVWQEWVKALSEPSAARFFDILVQCGAASIICADFLPRGYRHILTETRAAYTQPHVRFAALCFGMPATTLSDFLQRYPVPRLYADTAWLVQRHAATYVTLSADSAALVDFLTVLDVWRRPARLSDFCNACEPSARRAYRVADRLMAAYEVAKSIRFDPKMLRIPRDGKAVAAAMRAARIDAVSRVLAR